MSPKPNPRFQKIQSLIRRNDWKQAYKEAKFLAKQSGDPELQQILVTSLWNWIKDQVRRNQREEAKSNVLELLKIKEIPQEIRAEFPPVFRSLGLNSLLPEDLKQDTTLPKIQMELVDLFLLRNEQNADLLPETLVDAKRVQDAFQKIEAKLDTEALEILHPISFRSPLAEWRLFLRGLIDHYRGNDEKAAESWKRLSPDRPPSRIVANLRKLFLEKQNHASSGLISSFFGLFRGRNNDDSSQKTELLDSLRAFDHYIKQEKYKELVGRFHSFRSQFQKTEPILFERLFRLLHHQLVRNASPATIQQFVERHLPLPLDPHGNRTYGIVSEHIDDDLKFDRPRWLKDFPVYWKAFAEKDIDQIDSFSPKMKARAKAVVYDFLAGQALDGLFDIHQDEPENFDDPNDQVQVGFTRTEKEINNLLERSIASDPTYPEAYLHQQTLFLQSLPEKERKPFHPRIAEINKQLLEHVPDHIFALEYLFEYYFETKNPDAAKPFLEKLKELDPLSRKTAVQQHRFHIARIRKGLKERDFKQANEGISDLNNDPPLETVLYRFDLLPLALKYVGDVLQGNDPGIDDSIAVAAKLGVEKRLPLIFAILVEGKELGLPEKTVRLLESEWAKTISGRCHGNTAGVLGDLALNTLISKEYFRQAEKIVIDACEFVNRAGQVKWNSEKDIFGACHLLWYLAVKQKEEEYEKTFRLLSKKGLKQFPKSPFFLFFDAETYWLEPDWSRCHNEDEAIEKYQEFLKQGGARRTDPQYENFILLAEQRLLEIDNEDDEFLDDIYGGIGDDDDEEDEEDDDFPEFRRGQKHNFQPGFKIPPEMQREVQRNGGFPPGMKKNLEESLPKEVYPFRKLLVESLEECVLKGIPLEKAEQVMEQKMKNMPLWEQMKFMAGFAFNGGDDEDGEWEEPGDFSPFPKHKKKNKKKR